MQTNVGHTVSLLAIIFPAHTRMCLTGLDSGSRGGHAKGWEL
jgi:hypothetical protein